MSREMVAEIVKCSKKGMKPEAIIAHIGEERENTKEHQKKFENEPNPTNQQIYYRVSKNKDIEAPPIVNLGELIEWCAANSELPDDEDKAFVVNFDHSDHEEDLWFRFAVSTPRLIKQFVGVEKLCVDATYKLNWQGYPYFVAGTVDLAKKFHPLFFACCTNETTVDYRFVFRSIREAVKRLTGKEFNARIFIADGADAIRNAFYEEFPTAEIEVMCFAHVIRNIRKQKFKSVKNKNDILYDIRLIQLSGSPELFDSLTKLFLRKWSKIETEFCPYFKKQWLGVHMNWYEGASYYTPSTNNGVEGYNAVIKRLYTFRERLPFGQFATMIVKQCQDLAKCYKENKRSIANKPTVTLKLWRDAANWLTDLKFIETFTSEIVSDFCVPSNKFCGEFTLDNLNKAKRKTFKTFDSYVKNGFGQFYTDSLNKISWETESHCNCKVFLKDYACVHVVGLALKTRLCKLPKSAIPTELAKKNSVGRRPKSTRALLVK